jgi:hypothetical protein
MRYDFEILDWEIGKFVRGAGFEAISKSPNPKFQNQKDGNLFFIFTL